MRSESVSPSHHVCPWWLGYALLMPVRRWFEDPVRILTPYARPGGRVLDFGAGMGYFSLPAARMVGAGGRVVCIDLQEKMLGALRRRAARRGLEAVIETRCGRAGQRSLEDGNGSFDAAVAFHVIHETGDAEATFALLSAALRPEGVVLFAEPKGHVSEATFAEELRAAERAGLRQCGPIGGLRHTHSAVLTRRSATA